MQSFSEIIRIVTQRYPVKVDLPTGILDKNAEDASSRLCAAIQNGEVKRDSEAEKLIYNSTNNSIRYRTLKSRTRRKLLNSLFFLKLSKTKVAETTIAFYEANKLHFWVNVLLRFGARTTAIKLAEETLRLAERYEFTSISLEMLYHLRTQYTFLGEHNKFTKYNRLLKQTLRKLEAEYQAIELYQSLLKHFIKTNAEQPQLQRLAKEYYETLSILHSQNRSFSIGLNYYRTAVLYFQVAQQFRQAVRICVEAQEFLKGYARLTHPANVGEFAIYQLESFLYLRDYDGGKEAARFCESQYEKGLNNWFIYMRYYFLLEMHTQHFDNAKFIYNEVVNHPRLQVQPDVQKEIWPIYGMYLSYALNEFSNSSDKSKTRSDITLQSFLRQIPTYKQDKHGQNISVLVIHILYLLEQGDLDAIINRMEAIKTYRSRYLRVSFNSQSAIFFKLLLIMEANNFDYELTKEKAQRYFARIQKTRVSYGEMQDNLQILPFDWLWPRVLEKLKELNQNKRVPRLR